MFKDFLGEAFPLIEKVAPVVASVVGSPVAGSATVLAVNLLRSAFGVTSNDVSGIGKAILEHPDADDKLASIESLFGDWLKSNVQHFRLPKSAELNVKLEWEEISKQNSV